MTPFLQGGLFRFAPLEVTFTITIAVTGMGIEGEIVGTGLASLTLTQIQQRKVNGEVVDGMEFPGLRLQPIWGLCLFAIL